MKRFRAFMGLIMLFSLIGNNVLYAGSVFRNMGSAEKAVYLTFDDGPDKENTLNVMNILLEHNAGGTFFFTGVNIKRYPAVVKQVYDNGFSIGLHGYDHSSLAKAGPDGIKRQLNSTNDALESITGERSLSVRPPYGDLNQTAISTLDALGFNIYMWDVDPLDWSRNRNANQVLAEIKSSLKPGSIILLHSAVGHVKAAQILPELIAYLKENGYQMKALPDNGYKTAQAVVSSAALNIAGEPLDIPLYMINGANYVMVRDLAEAVANTAKPFDVIWNKELGAIELTKGEQYSFVDTGNINDRKTAYRARPTHVSVITDGKTTQISSYLLESSYYLNLRELAETVGFSVSYDDVHNTISLAAEIDLRKMPEYLNPRFALCLRVWSLVFWRGVLV